MSRSIPKGRRAAFLFYGRFQAARVVRRNWIFILEKEIVSRKNSVLVYDSSSRSVLFRVTREKAINMIERREAFVVLSEPLQIALTRKPRLKEMNGKPDRSLTVPPSVLIDAADGSPACCAIVNGYKKNHEGELR